jgi:molybdopterin synthase catalytic subunit
MARISVQRQDFDIGAEIAALTAGRTDIGGIGCFVGTVRDNPNPAPAGMPGPGGTPRPEPGPGQKSGTEGRPAPVAAMTLEHYPGMTERAISRITDDAERRWSLLGCTVIHRVGRLMAGENIVLVMAAASHRQAALDATAFLIDWLKTKAPFWKREEFSDGRGEWVDAREADDAAAARWS